MNNKRVMRSQHKIDISQSVTLNKIIDSQLDK